jgi:hypothetical protein
VSAFGEIDEQRLEALRRALELDDPPQPLRRARLLALQALELLYEHEHSRRRALAAEAIEVAHEAGDHRTLAEVLRAAFFANRAPDTLDLRIRLADELLASAEASGDPALELWAHYAELHVDAESGKFERAPAALERMELIADDLGQPSLKWFAGYPAAGWALMRGEMTRCEELAKKALQIGSDAGEPDAILVYGTQFFPLRVLQGGGEEELGLFEKMAAANPRIPGLQAAVAWAYCWLDRRHDAAAVVERAAGDGFDHVPWDQARTSALAFYADAASQTGLTHAAGVLHELIEPWADQAVWNGAEGFGHFRTYLGLLATTLGWHERADEHFALACAIQEGKGMLLWAARAHLGWAEALAGRGEGERAQAEAARALELARQHDYGAIERRAGAVVEAGSAATR